MAPEMLRNEGYDFLSDVWSIGPTAEFAHFPVNTGSRLRHSICATAGSVAYLLVFGSFPYSPGEVQTI